MGLAVDECLDNSISEDVKKANEVLGQQDAEQPTTPVKSRLQIPIPFEFKRPRRQNTRVFETNKLKKYLGPVLSHLERHEHSGPFLQPVDAEALGLVNYNDIVKQKMDLSTIRLRLETGFYIEPWQFIDDVWLMLDNAKRFNRKGTNVYRGAELLGKLFDEEVDRVMQEKMKYCCGKRLFYTPPTLFCVGKRVCIIPRETTYYSHGEQYIYCKKCFAAIPGDKVPLHNERQEIIKYVLKEEFDFRRNDHLEPEPLVPCRECGRLMHQICCMYLDHFWPDGYICENCRRPAFTPPVLLTAETLVKTRLSEFIESRVSNFLITSGAVDIKVAIRVVSSRDRLAQLKPQMNARFPERNGFPYRAKAIFAFLQLEGHEIAFFGMHVQEYGSDCPSPNNRRVYIGYLDSVQYFRPRELRTAVYREVLLGYLEYVRLRGFLTVHIWACPPGNDDDYIFHCHPPQQKIPQPGRLQEWYKTILRKGQEDKIVMEFKNLYKYILDEGLNPVDDLPYFEGDFWPMILEDSLKDIDKEEEKKKEEANANVTVAQGGPDSRLKKKPKKTIKRLSHHLAKDLPTKMINVIKRHQESFLVVILNTTEAIVNLPMRETEDGDCLLYADLMDGRDGLLSVAMERHYEFSSYRRAMFSTMLLLFELSHSEDQNVFMCSSCNLHFTKGFRCMECESESASVDMCPTCHDTERHIHDMTQIETKRNQTSQTSLLQLRMALVIGVLHAYTCFDDSCTRSTCQQYKQLYSHASACPRNSKDKCEECRPMAQLLKAHARFCIKVHCPVPNCSEFKMGFRLERVNKKFKHNRCLQRRMRMMLQQKSEQEPDSGEQTTIVDDIQPMELD
ncbi:CREB-binding protein [Orchesella cincta]|uniref:histone acetyltransferase n=1 Tax=Orchesella cincta TaxID=48709 RepID=A0A1D2N5Y2_ORCCI|nr:CREB-binding protein [Orchesella cincta]